MTASSGGGSIPAGGNIIERLARFGSCARGTVGGVGLGFLIKAAKGDVSERLGLDPDR